MTRNAARQVGQLAIEALWLLEVRHVTDVLVPRAFRRRAGHEDVFSHRRQHDSVQPAVGDEQRHLEGTQHVVAVDLARDEIGADARRYCDVPAHGRLQIVARYGFHHARSHEGTHGEDVGWQVVRGGVDEMVEEARAYQRAERRLAELGHAFDEVDRSDATLAIHAYVVTDDERAVRPPDEYRCIEMQLVDDRGHVVGPKPTVGVVPRLERRLGHAVTTQVVGDEPELLRERALVLLRPAEMVLRPAVNEEDRRPVRAPPLAHVQPESAATCDRMNPHPAGRFLIVMCNRCHRSPPRARPIGWIVGVAEPKRIGRGALSLPGSLRIFGRWVLIKRPR